MFMSLCLSSWRERTLQSNAKLSTTPITAFQNTQALRTLLNKAPEVHLEVRRQHTCTAACLRPADRERSIAALSRGLQKFTGHVDASAPESYAAAEVLLHVLAHAGEEGWRGPRRLLLAISKIGRKTEEDVSRSALQGMCAARSRHLPTVLSSLLHTSHNLVSLDLYDNMLGPHGVSLLAAALSQSPARGSLEHLELGCNAMSDEV